jgi:hypothetical protein
MTGGQGAETADASAFSNESDAPQQKN